MSMFLSPVPDACFSTLAIAILFPNFRLYHHNLRQGNLNIYVYNFDIKKLYLSSPLAKIWCLRPRNYSKAYCYPFFTGNVVKGTLSEAFWNTIYMGLDIKLIFEISKFLPKTYYWCRFKIYYNVFKTSME